MKKTGFGLIETSILLVIVAFMSISALSLYSMNSKNKSLEIKKLKEKYIISKIEQLDTNSRLNKIYEAIKNFVILNHRLPCPDNDSDGIEASNPGSCDDTNQIHDENNLNENIIYNNLPYGTLELLEEFSRDEWNNNFVYYVDKRFTKKTNTPDAITGFAATKTMHQTNNDANSDPRIGDPNFEIINVSKNSNPIEPSDGLNNNIRPSASYIFVIVSGGKNVDLNGTTLPTAFNYENRDNNDNIFKTIDENDNDNKDILLFKNKQEILKDAKLSHFLCSQNDGDIIFNADTEDDHGNLGSCASGATISFDNIVYKKNNYSKANCPCAPGLSIVRRCEEYGIWQNIESMTQDQCNQ